MVIGKAAIGASHGQEQGVFEEIQLSVESNTEAELLEIEKRLFKEE
ncbi:MAG: hypothetical protein LIP16_12565 [Clostridium sp.]|nr:hypothetical protein [Clostridium sp.]